MNWKEKIRGIIVPILTPMDKDEEINEEELRNQVRRLIACGVLGIFTFGTNGEGYILSEKEKEQVLGRLVSMGSQNLLSRCTFFF